MAFSADRSGGFAQPNIVLTALSARKGLVSGSASDAAQGKINPAAYFGATDAKLFGTIPLGDLIPVDPQNLAGARAERPHDPHPGQAERAAPEGTGHRPDLAAPAAGLRRAVAPDAMPVKVLFNAAARRR